VSMKKLKEKELSILRQIDLAERERDAIGKETGYNLVSHRFWNADKKVIRLKWQWEVIRRKMGEKW